jgi:hypothetical protein
MSDWANLDKIFLANAHELQSSNYGMITKEWIEEHNPPYIEQLIVKPLCFIDNGQSLLWRKIIRHYRDGRVERKYMYNSMDNKIDNMSALGPLGYRIIEQIKYKNNQQEEANYDRCNCISNNRE